MTFSDSHNLQEELSLLAKSQQALTFGKIMLILNELFYGDDETKIGAGGDFETISSVAENRHNFSEILLTSMYISWLKEKKEVFNCVEFGAGSGDLMKEIHKIVQEKKSKCDPESIEGKFYNSLKFHIMDLPEMIEKQKSELQDLNINFYEFNAASDKKIEEIFGSKIDFGFSNEFFDTQAIDFLEVKNIDGKNTFFLNAYQLDSDGNLISIKIKISDELSRKIQAISGLDVDNCEPNKTYPLQLGFLKAIHNFKESCVDSMHSDYLLTEENDRLYGKLKFCGLTLKKLTPEILSTEVESQPQALQLVVNSTTTGFDVTYAPIVYKELYEKFGNSCVVGGFGLHITEQFLFIGENALEKATKISEKLLPNLMVFALPLDYEDNPTLHACRTGAKIKDLVLLPPPEKPDPNLGKSKLVPLVDPQKKCKQ